MRTGSDRPSAANLATWALCGGLAACLSATAWAGRPLSTDDAATADAGTCQIESWIESTRGEQALVISPACGVAAGLEVDADYTVPQRQDALRARSSLSLKWAPSAGQLETAAGKLSVGLKLHSGFEHAAGADWTTAETGVLALASLQGDEWALHANLGPTRDRRTGATATLASLALTWAPGERSLLFVETQANDRSAVFGAPVRTLGGAWWLVPERLGLHLTASRGPDRDGRTLWTAGFGWYGLGW